MLPSLLTRTFTMEYLLIALAVLMVIVVGVMVCIAEKIIKGRKDD